MPVFVAETHLASGEGITSFGGTPVGGVFILMATAMENGNLQSCIDG